jgi:uncharacterized repeat protein (TIGR03803 family)
MTHRSPGAASARRLIGAGLLVTGSILLIPPAYAQDAPFTFLHKFSAGPRVPSGRLVETPDGSLYGTTACGGEPDSSCSGGTIFALRPRADGTWGYEDLHHFRPGLEGANPTSGLTLARDGSLYGIASKGGLPHSQAWGTVFRLSPSGSLAPVYAFTDRHPIHNGEGPVGRVMEAADGNLYGATCLPAGAGPVSGIFSLTPSGSYSTIYRFPRIATGDAPNGMCPITQLHEASDGFLYGTTIAGGPSISPSFPPQGTLFRLDRGGAAPSVTVLHTFRGFNGAVPTGEMTAGSPGEFFGTTAAGGSVGQGVFYRRDPSGAVHVLDVFRGSNGATPYAGLFRSPDGALYGTTLRGGRGHGTVFRAGASGITLLHAFNGDDGSVPVEVMRARDGNLYGVTAIGGPGGGGTVFRVTPDSTLTTVHAFVSGPQGPQSGVIQARDGNFYGAAEGGRYGGGVVFRLTPTGQMTILHEFAPALASPFRFGPSVAATGLLEASDGFLYGRTAFGGVHNRGTIYRLSTGGAFTLLHHFAGSDGYAGGYEGLIQASDGHLYGLTSANSGAAATLFKMDASGTFTTVYTFGEAGGPAPVGPLVEGPDGALFGVASRLGSPGLDGLFKVTTSGVFTVLHSFDQLSPIGYRAVGGLIRSVDGGLYGVTSFGIFNPASIYRFDPVTNDVTLIAPLDANNGADVVETRDGALYGWAVVPGLPRERIRFFRFADGALEYFYDATEAGRGPSELMQGADGALYGTMAESASRPEAPETWPSDAFAGGVFRLTIPSGSPTATARVRSPK